MQMYTEEEYKEYGSSMYWSGAAVGAIGMALITIIISVAFH